MELTAQEKREHLGVGSLLKMHTMGMPDTVLTQRLCMHLQVEDNHPTIAMAVEAITKHTVSEALVDALLSLSATKYERMRAKGQSEKRILSHRSFEEASYPHTEKVVGSCAQAKAVDPATYAMAAWANSIDCVVDDNGCNIKSSSASKRAVNDSMAAIANHTNIYIDSTLERVEEELRQATPVDGEQGYSEPSDDTSPMHVAADKPADALLARDGPAPEIVTSSEELMHPLTGVRYQCHTHLRDRLFTVSPIMSESHCKSIVERLDFSDKEETIKRKMVELYRRKGLRVMRTSLRRRIADSEVAAVVWKAVKNVVPERLSDGRTLAGVRTGMNFYRYKSGEFFDTHLDGGHTFFDTGISSEYTFVLYLNGDYEGGATQFCNVDEWESDGSAPGETCRQVTGEAGKLLIFRQEDMMHRGSAVHSGSKYIIQGMVMYQSILVNRLGKPVGKQPHQFKAFHRAF